MSRRPAGPFVAAALLLAAAGCSAPSRPSRVVLVTFDTTRADRLGCYGYEQAATPALDGLALEGVLFEQAVSPAPTTLPAHSTILTGLYPQDHGVRYNIHYRLNAAATTLAETLGQAGFATAAFPATQIVGRRTGLDQGFEHWAEPPSPEHGERQVHPVEVMRRAEKGVDLALEWIEEQRGRDQFVWLHFYDPHWPYTPPFPFSSQYRDRAYDGEIAYADAQLARLLEGLRSDPEWKRTLVVIAGDHGEGLYDHGERYHSTLVYETTQRVPLIVRAPGLGPGRVSEPVSLADVMPTILELCRVDPPPAQRGLSLLAALKGKPLPRRDIYFETLTGAINYGWDELTGLRYGPWKLIQSGDPELYNLDDDPAESRNLASEEPGQMAELREVLERLSAPLSGSGDAGQAVVELDPATLAELTSLGYVAGMGSRAGIENAPHPRTFMDLEAELLAAQGALANGRFDEVEEVCRYVLDRDPTNLWALSSLTQALLELDRAGEALEPARRLAEINPTGAHAHVSLATVYRSLERVEDAYKTLIEGLQQAPASEQLAYLTLVTAFELERGDACGAPAQVAFQAHAGSSRILMLRARCEARAGRTEAALDTLGQAVERGFTQLDVLETTQDFAAVVASPRFRDLRARVEAAAPPEESDPSDSEEGGEPGYPASY